LRERIKQREGSEASMVQDVLKLGRGFRSGALPQKSLPAQVRCKLVQIKRYPKKFRVVVVPGRLQQLK
jgi:hypothetical protein